MSDAPKPRVRKIPSADESPAAGHTALLCAMCLSIKPPRKTPAQSMWDGFAFCVTCWEMRIEFVMQVHANERREVTRQDNEKRLSMLSGSLSAEQSKEIRESFNVMGSLMQSPPSPTVTPTKPKPFAQMPKDFLDRITGSSNKPERCKSTKTYKDPHVIERCVREDGHPSDHHSRTGLTWPDAESDGAVPCPSTYQRLDGFTDRCVYRQGHTGPHESESSRWRDQGQIGNDVACNHSWHDDTEQALHAPAPDPTLHQCDRSGPSAGNRHVHTCACGARNRP